MRFKGPMLAGNLYLRVVWFYNRGYSDVDNILKPVLDALQGVVFRNDRFIVKVSSERVDTRRTYELASDPGVAPEAYGELVELLGTEESDVTYVEVGMLPTRLVALGPIDGGVVW